MKHNRRSRSVDGLNYNGRRTLDEFKPIGHASTPIAPGPRFRAAPAFESFSDLNNDLNAIQEQKPKRGLRRRQRKPKKSLRRRIVRTLIFLTLLVGIGLILQAFWAGNSIIKRDGGASALALRDNLDPNLLRGEGDGRVNILLIGVGGEGHAGGQLSDTILVMSVDPIAKDVAMLSIPRDLYVSIPGYGSSRINSAHAYGQQNGKNEGPVLLSKTVEQVLGIDIHYYARVDFQGFVQAVDTVGGIDVKVEQSLYDSTYPSKGLRGTEVFQLSAGPQHLNGETALKYVRCRKGTCGNDYGRAARQQQALIALKDKALSLGILSNPAKVSGLLNAVGKNAETNLQPSEIFKLMEIAKEIDTSKVETKVLDTTPEGLLAAKNIGGASVLVPRAGIGNYTDIQIYVRSLFMDGFIRKEKPTVTVLNGTLTAGLAKSAGETLDSYGYKVEDTGDAPTSDYLNTIIIFNGETKKPYTAQYLRKRFGAPIDKKLPEGVESTSDFIIILGSDYKPTK